MLDERRPGDGFLGEEGGDAAGTTGLRWIVDPLDGTVNFVFGIPQWCVSVAVADGDGTVAGVVHDPLRGETFAAVRGEPATLTAWSSWLRRRATWGRRWWPRASPTTRGCGSSRGRWSAGLIGEVRDLRRCGSAALDLAWTAAGRYDAYYERAMNAWDVAAGELLCRSAGLELRRLPAKGVLPEGLMAAPAGLADRLAGLVS